MSILSETMQNTFSDEQIYALTKTVSAATDLTADNIKALRPIQQQFKTFYNLLPKGKDGWVDETCDTFKEFRKFCRDLTLNRLVGRPEYTISYYKTPDDAGELVWRQQSGKVEIDPVKFPCFTVTGAIADPRAKFRHDDKTIFESCVEPVRTLMLGAERQTFSRLKPKKPRSGVTKAQDFGAKFNDLMKKVSNLRDTLKTEEFPVKDETSFKKAVAQLAMVLGLGAQK